MQGILPGSTVTVISARWVGADIVELTYKDPTGRLGEEIVFREKEPELVIPVAGRPWSFDGDANLFKLVAEAHRIRLAYLFDPMLAVHTSDVQPLPHQITAVYQSMLPRQPLRFLLADDPGAGKTIMAGLLIKELRARGDLQRCLIVSPGSLVEQWQDELDKKFHLPFEILTNDKLEASRTGNWFGETSLVIARLDKLSRDPELQEKLRATDWDLIVCDEAHKMSATFFGGEVKYTKRYHLGQLLGSISRHFLLMTATPHNGKEEDFQLFLALIDGDRFEGKFRDGVHTVDVSDVMRRLVKEELVKMDGTPLFPERRAYTLDYKLSEDEALLYDEVTRYVREEWNRAEQLENEGRRGTVGFALTTLQRRLASSPEAIYQSLRRRRERLEERVREEKLQKRGAELAPKYRVLAVDELDELDEMPDAEVEELEEAVVDQATAARTVAELEAEISGLRELEAIAKRVRRGGRDKKWEELSSLLQENALMSDAAGARRKLVIFTEHRDTLNYLSERIVALLGSRDAVVMIHGAMGRDERKKAEGAFKQEKDVHVLIATDAAGEGINLQRAHLMVNYDLPWNPNRLEQRFGRIHRIGQTEVCHLWNLVAGETREGDVYRKLLQKIDEERGALGGQVFDVLGKLSFDNRPLRELLVEAIRYGDRREVRERLFTVVDRSLDRKVLQDLIEERALAHDSMDAALVRRVREAMERADARRLQPHFVSAFFREALSRLGGSQHEREAGRYEVTHVPGPVRARGRELGRGDPVRTRYHRIAFEKSLVQVQGKPEADFVCPGHPLLDATLDVVLERHRDLLKRGVVLVDGLDPGTEMRVLFFVEHAVQDARADRAGQRRIVSRRVQFAELTEGGEVLSAGHAPYLDYRVPTEEELAIAEPLLEKLWLRENLERRVTAHIVSHLVQEHFAEVKQQKQANVAKTLAAVKERLTKEIIYWDHRAEELRAREQSGKATRLNSAKASQRADELKERLQKRLAELLQEQQLSPLAPVIIAGALIVPQGLLRQLGGDAEIVEQDEPSLDRQRVEILAMEAVMGAERALGFEPRSVAAEKCGYDIESRDSASGRLRFIEVKGRVSDARTVTITKNEILTALNKPEDFILAIVNVEGDRAGKPSYLRRPFTREPDFGATSVTYELNDLLTKARSPY